LYSSQKKGTRDYEKYGNIALHDEITDQPIEEISKNDEIKK
jgi:cytochrome c oxidase cbb3-type subunit 4